MDTCDNCGQSTDHAFQCNHCKQSFCGDHRLPENHDCPVFVVDDDLSSFTGEGPETNDRRSTWRKRKHRVRQKEDAPTAPDPVSPQSKSDHRSSEADLAVLTCPSCGRETDQINDCDQCGQSVCPDCEGRYEHECPSAVTKSKEPDADDGTFLSKLIGLLR
jgi:predicted nucleic acid binding AN1-type Zn finger protein